MQDETDKIDQSSVNLMLSAIVPSCTTGATPDIKRHAIRSLIYVLDFAACVVLAEAPPPLPPPPPPPAALLPTASSAAAAAPPLQPELHRRALL